jgi:putative hydrolase of the HAD superfamily
MIQAIVYDAVGTLIHVKPSVARLYAECGRRHGSRLDEAEVARRFPVAFAHQDRLDAQSGWRTSEARERRRWRDIVAEVLDDVVDSAGCFEALFAVFGKPDAWTCDPATAEVLVKVHGAGYRQAVASNFDERLHAVIAGMPELRHLEQIVVSSEVGWRKPAAEFFAALAERLRLPPDAILFVGDDCVNDFDAACRAGMRGLLLDPRGHHAEVAAERLENLEALWPWIVVATLHPVVSLRSTTG